jgi:hypothetical protein
MTQATSTSSFAKLKRFMADYRSQLEKASAAIQVLEASEADEKTFSQTLANLHVSAIVLESYSEMMVEAADF